ncbi:MAG: hypothetical protein AAGC77_07115 [Pseudomonadota bacterium]
MADKSQSQKTMESAKKGGKPAPWARLVIAVFLGYLAATLATGALTSLLPIQRGEQTVLSLLLVGLVYAALFVYVFALSGWSRALRDLCILCAVSGGVLVLTKGLLF